MTNFPIEVNPHASHPTSPVALVRNLWRNRQLIVQMAKREVVGRYKGSLMGMAWSFFNPLLMLVIYTFVFSVVFKARWCIAPQESKMDFAIMLFIGMIIHGLFAADSAAAVEQRARAFSALFTD